MTSAYEHTNNPPVVSDHLPPSTMWCSGLRWGVTVKAHALPAYTTAHTCCMLSSAYHVVHHGSHGCSKLIQWLAIQAGVVLTRSQRIYSTVQGLEVNA